MRQGQSPAMYLHLELFVYPYLIPILVSGSVSVNALLLI